VIIVAPGSEYETEIEFFRRQHGRFVLKLKGIDAISQAEQCRGAEIKIPISALPSPQGSFYTFQLRGCRVFTADGEYIGYVTDIIESGGTDILKVDNDREETLIPFAEAYLKKVDLSERRIEVDLPEGLRGLNR